MIWATVSSQSCFCWLYRTSPSLAAKNIINLILVLAIWWGPCVVFSCVIGRGCLLWPVRFLAKTLLTFALLHSVLQGQICLLLQVFFLLLQFKSKFGNKEFMIWATVSSQSCFCWLYKQSTFGCKEYNQSDFGIDHLVMSMCRVFSCVVGRGCLLWPVRSLGKTLLAFALLHSVFQGQIRLLLQVFLDLPLLHSSPL